MITDDEALNVCAEGLHLAKTACLQSLKEIATERELEIETEEVKTQNWFESMLYEELRDRRDALGTYFAAAEMLAGAYLMSGSSLEGASEGEDLEAQRPVQEGEGC